LKQAFLVDQIINKGFNPVEFAQFLETKRDNGTDIDNWTLRELHEVSYEFIFDYGAASMQNQTAEEESHKF